MTDSSLITVTVKKNIAGIEVVAVSAIIEEPEPAIHFIADHPFIFYIMRDSDVLFVGRKNK